MNGYEEADRLTDAELERLERKLERNYREAAGDMQKEISDYFTSFAKREKQYRAMVEAGTMTEEEFTRWRLGAIGRGERMKALRDKLAERMTQANEEAAAMMNRAMPGIFVLNGNYTAYQISREHGDIDWTLWNEEAVRRIIRDDPDLMPYYPAARAVRRGIDLDWGRRQITAQVISSILLGDSLGTIAEKLMGRIEGMNATSAKRTARTAVTEAQNAGRQSAFEMAAELGIKLHRRWVATKDLRTRHAHAMADHQIVAVDEPFTVGGEKIMFPGSGSLGASGWNLYNCRCTVVSSEKEGIEAEPRMMRVWDPVKREWVLMEDVSYSQWYEAMKARHGESAMEEQLRRIKNESADRQLWKKHVAEFGIRAPKTFASFKQLKYDSGEWEAYKDYTAALRRGELTTLATFNLYQRTSREIDETLVGIKTSNGIEIKGKTKHFIPRVIGSIKQRRSGVEIADVLLALTSPEATVFPGRTSSIGERSQKFRFGEVEVSVNPDTGILIQTNPYHRGRS